jgi:nucleotide-binding universal stress UspA family protein
MLSRILVPLDGSSLAERALPCARMLARGLGAELALFRAIALPPDFEEILSVVDLEPERPLAQLAADADDYLCRVGSRLEEDGLCVQKVVQLGRAAEAIVDYAEKVGIQLTVMATHGHSGVSRWRHGSVAERVLQSASVPVLIVCSTESEGMTPHRPMACHRVLVPLDGSSVAEQVLPTVTTVAQALDAELVLLRVPIAQVSGSLMGEWCMPLEGTFDTANHIAESYLERLAERLRADGVRVFTTTRMGAVANVIIEYAEANQIDLIAMCTHGRTGLARWALGSVADRVLRARCLPLLLVRAH